ncbi:MAG: ESX secretion-associated protein EspG [Pseudonocardiaceae bacterium]
MAEQVHLPMLVADAVRDRLQVTLPPGLPITFHGRDEEERRMLLAQGWEHARAIGVVGPRGRIADLVEDSFRLLDAPEVVAEIVVGDLTTGTDRTSIAALSRTNSVLAYLTDEGIWVGQIGRGDAARALHSTLPDTPPGPGPRSASVPATVLARAGAANHATSSALAAALSRGGVAAVDARMFADVFSRQRLRAAVAGASSYRPGSRQPRPVPLNVDLLDTDAGRYLTQARSGHVLLARGQRELIIERVDELVRMAYEQRR